MSFDIIKAVIMGTDALIKAVVNPCIGFKDFGLKGTFTVLPSSTLG